MLLAKTCAFMSCKRGGIFAAARQLVETWSKCAKLKGARSGRGRQKLMEYGPFTVASTRPCLSDSRGGFSSDNGSPTDPLLGQTRIFIPQVTSEQLPGTGY